MENHMSDPTDRLSKVAARRSNSTDFTGSNLDREKPAGISEQTIGAKKDAG